MAQQSNREKIKEFKATQIAGKKKYFVQVTDNTKRLPANNLLQFVIQLMNISKIEANSDIENNEVTVNGNLITDPEHMLKSGDVVRVEIGHIIQNIGYMAVVE